MVFVIDRLQSCGGAVHTFGELWKTDLRFISVGVAAMNCAFHICLFGATQINSRWYPQIDGDFDFWRVLMYVL